MSRHVYVIRILTVFMLFVAGFGLLAKHLYALQVERHDELVVKARHKYTASRTSAGNRGRIFDMNGNLLVGNIACQDIRALPENIKEERRAYLIDCLVRELDVQASVLRQRLASGLKEIVIKNEVDLQTANRLKALELPGLRFVDTQRRQYPKGRMLANVLGFTQRANVEGHSINQGVMGIEAICNNELAPRFGRVTYERDRKGRQLHRETPKAPESLDGKNVYLTIHEPIQHIVETELAELVREFAPKTAYAIMSDPRTGAILAVAQIPSFDPNDRRDDERAHWTSRFVSDIYEPGSAMKGISIAAAIDCGVVNLNTVYDCEKGYWFYAGRMLRDAGHKYEDMSVADIVKHSSNIGTAKIAIDMGEPRLYQALRRFGFGQPTGIELPAETAGIFRPLSRWDSLSITRFPIGQGLGVTPLQMVQAYGSLANNGDMMKLHLIDRIEDPITGEVIRRPAVFKNATVRPSTVKQITAALTLVTQEGGTATRAAVPGYDVAGKTGTAQKFVNGTYNSGKYTASFIGYVPADNPELVLLIVADEPAKRSYYGGTVCGPAFSRIAEETLRYLNTPPSVPVTAETFERNDRVRHN